MAWVKLDDKFWSNPKLEKVGNEAAGAYARMLSYCGDQLTDGIVTRPTATYIARPKVVTSLLEFGFLVPHGDDYRIPDYLDFNPSREQTLQKRAKDRERKRDEDE